MGGFREYRKYDALGLASLVKTKKVKPSELSEEAISRIEKINPEINAVIYKMYNAAEELNDKKPPAGIFSGVPFLVKDIIHQVAGVPYTAGSRSLKNYVPAEDSEVTRRYRKAGLVILGKTNLPEFGLMGYTEPLLHGPCRNPWDTSRTPGGSSGGSAAAVAAGIVPMASANDGGGSIRIPAANCGLFGMKASRGRTPLGPRTGEVWQGAAVEGVLSRSVRDSAAALDELSQPDPGAPYIIQPPIAPYLREINRKPGKLKIAFSSRSMLDSDVHPECVRAVEEAADLCVSLGHVAEYDEPELDGKAIAFAYMMLYMGEVAADIEMTAELTGKIPGRKNFEAVTWFLGLLGRTYSAGDFVREKRLWNTIARSFSNFFEKYDIFLTPVTAYPPLKIGELQPKPAEKKMVSIVNTLGLGRIVKASGMISSLAQATMEKYPFTQIANMAGLPAMSVPLHWTPEGLPCGVQFIGRFGDEAMLFRLAAQLEKAKPWFSRWPEML
ncbi:MAG: amidase [Spirochaetes bacterium]|nr:amidase [Spirochaetota bacterium]